MFPPNKYATSSLHTITVTGILNTKSVEKSIPKISRPGLVEKAEDLGPSPTKQKRVVMMNELVLVGLGKNA